MKKTYIIPAVEPLNMELESMLAASIQTVGGDAELELGKGVAPTTADVKQSIFDQDLFE